LIVVLVLSLCSCGSEYKKYAKYAELFELLEDNNYQGAVQMIIGMAQENQKPNDGNGDGTEETPTMLSAVGRYVVTDVEDKTCDIRFVTYQEDGTLLLNDTAIPCEIDSLGETYCRLKVTDSDTYGAVSFSQNE